MYTASLLNDNLILLLKIRWQAELSVVSGVCIGASATIIAWNPESMKVMLITTLLKIKRNS